jgi:hypothetical protein
MMVASVRGCEEEFDIYLSLFWGSLQKQAVFKREAKSIIQNRNNFYTESWRQRG